MDLDGWLGSSRTEVEGGMLSQKLLKKRGLEGAGRAKSLDTRTSGDDSADDEPGWASFKTHSRPERPHAVHCWRFITTA